MFPDSPVIKKTLNYEMFKKIKWNRNLDKTNIDKLLTENQKDFKLHQFPILVTKDFKVIDGQHRLHVAKELGSPVYYIVGQSDESFESVHSVNKAGKKHSLKDKIEMLGKANDHGASEVYKVFEMFNEKFNLSTVASILIASGSGGGLNSSIDQHGKIILGNYKNGLQILQALNSSAIPFYNTNRVVFAISYICNKTGKTPSEIVERVEANLIKWIDPRSTQESIRVISSCYNYGLSDKRRIKL